MTGLLASVCSVEEASLAAKHGVDIIDLKEPSEGALGALPVDIVNAILATVDGVCPTSATIGDIPFKAELIHPRILTMAATGVDIIKIGVFGELRQEKELELLASLSSQGMRLVLVLFAEDFNRAYDASILGRSGITGVMLDTRDKSSGALLDKLEITEIRAWLQSNRDAGLISGLAGSLSLADIEVLLPLEADYLGFRGALCLHNNRKTQIDEARLASLRAQIPESKRNILQTGTII